MKTFLAWCKRYFLVNSVVFFLCAGTAYYFYWHWRPFTQNAFLLANTRPVTPLVDGYLTHIHVKNNEQVKKGAPLITTYREPYRLNVESLRGRLAASEAAERSAAAKIAAAEADVLSREAELANAKYLHDRAQVMYAAAAVSQEYAEERHRAHQARTGALEAARNTVSSLRADLSRIQAETSSLRADLSNAQIAYEQTVVYAESDGCAVNMSMIPGAYCRAGEVLFGFVDTSVWWVQANLKESELSGIAPGVSASIWLWQYPGKTFHGVVEHIGWSVERRKFASATGISEVQKENEWFLLPQRFPVQIRITDPDPEYPFHAGGSAYVELDIESRPIRQFFWELFLWTWE